MSELSESDVRFKVSSEAAEVVKGALRDEDDSEFLALWVDISGVTGGNFDYDVYFERLSDAGVGDFTSESEGVAIVIPEGSIDRLIGASLDVSADGGLVITNPNSPLPVGGDVPDFGPEALSSDIARQVQAILQEEINPSIASHGGRADLVGVVEDVVYVVLSGGCQGCGMASVTLSQGIEVSIKEAIPSIVAVRDVTDHMSGSNPYYAAAKK